MNAVRQSEQYELGPDYGDYSPYRSFEGIGPGYQLARAAVPILLFSLGTTASSAPSLGFPSAQNRTGSSVTYRAREEFDSQSNDIVAVLSELPAEPAYNPTSVVEQVVEVQAAFALNKSQLAQVFGVSRPTVYDWLDGKEPNDDNLDRLSALVRVLDSMGLSSNEPLNTRFVRRPLEQGERSLLDMLAEDDLAGEKIRSVVQAAISATVAAKSKSKEREDRARENGFDETSFEQRRATLATNVALRDWPKS